MGVQARLRLERTTFELDADVAFTSGRVTSIVGPSGAGKTSLLRCLAGLEPQVSGRVVVDGRTWLDGKRALPTHRRRVGFVFQEASLFEHLDVRRNLRYGYDRIARAERRAAFDEVVEWLELGPLLSRRTAHLSGGERQRVALGRALLASPRLLLIDEPLSALDLAARERLLPWIAALPSQLEAPVVHVTHSLREVARLADDLVVLEAGRVVAAGPARELLPKVGAQDDELAVALVARVAQHHASDGLSELALGDARLFARRVDVAVGERVQLVVQARDVAVALAPDRGSSILNELAVRLVGVREAGAGVVLELDAEDGQRLFSRVTRRSARELGLDERALGRELFARVKAVGVGSHAARAPRE